jgi:hypothetical protein
MTFRARLAEIDRLKIQARDESLTPFQRCCARRELRRAARKLVSYRKRSEGADGLTVRNQDLMEAAT